MPKLVPRPAILDVNSTQKAPVISVGAQPSLGILFLVTL